MLPAAKPFQAAVFFASLLGDWAGGIAGAQGVDGARRGGVPNPPIVPNNREGTRPLRAPGNAPCPLLTPDQRRVPPY